MRNNAVATNLTRKVSQNFLGFVSCFIPGIADSNKSAASGLEIQNNSLNNNDWWEETPQKNVEWKSISDLG